MSRRRPLRGRCCASLRWYARRRCRGRLALGRRCAPARDEWHRVDRDSCSPSQDRRRDISSTRPTAKTEVKALSDRGRW